MRAFFNKSERRKRSLIDVPSNWYFGDVTRKDSEATFIVRRQTAILKLSERQQ